MGANVGLGRLEVAVVVGEGVDRERTCPPLATCLLYPCGQPPASAAAVVFAKDVDTSITLEPVQRADSLALTVLCTSATNNSLNPSMTACTALRRELATMLKMWSAVGTV